MTSFKTRNLSYMGDVRQGFLALMLTRDNPVWYARKGLPPTSKAGKSQEYYDLYCVGVILKPDTKKKEEKKVKFIHTCVIFVLQLMRTHMDYMERAKMLMGSDRIAEMANSPRSRSVLHNPCLLNTFNMLTVEYINYTFSCWRNLHLVNF
jgi:hypothetical protein